MKKLKLDHELAQLVLAGEKTSTWRMFDDKDLTVNDELQFIDKVDPAAPQTWRVIGTGRINRIIEKRLGDITDEDYEGHEPHESPQARLQAYRGYYGDRVSMDTPIKMLHFSFQPSAGGDGETVDLPQLVGEKVIVYADGGSRGNPVPRPAVLSLWTSTIQCWSIRASTSALLPTTRRSIRR